MIPPQDAAHRLPAYNNYHKPTLSYQAEEVPGHPECTSKHEKQQMLDRFLPHIPPSIAPTPTSTYIESIEDDDVLHQGNSLGLSFTLSKTSSAEFLRGSAKRFCRSIHRCRIFCIFFQETVLTLAIAPLSTSSPIKAAASSSTPRSSSSCTVFAKLLRLALRSGTLHQSSQVLKRETIASKNMIR